MAFVTLPRACELAQGGSTNRSGIGKTSTEAVRNRLRRGLRSPRRYQAARSGPVTSSVIGIYRAGLAWTYKNAGAGSPEIRQLSAMTRKMTSQSSEMASSELRRPAQQSTERLWTEYIFENPW